MDPTLDAIFFAVAIVVFLIAAFASQLAARVNLVALGLAVATFVFFADSLDAA